MEYDQEVEEKIKQEKNQSKALQLLKEAVFNNNSEQFLQSLKEAAQNSYSENEHYFLRTIARIWDEYGRNIYRQELMLLLKEELENFNITEMERIYDQIFDLTHQGGRGQPIFSEEYAQKFWPLLEIYFAKMIKMLKASKGEKQ